MMLWQALFGMSLVYYSNTSSERRVIALVADPVPGRIPDRVLMAEYLESFLLSCFFTLSHPSSPTRRRQSTKYLFAMALLLYFALLGVIRPINLSPLFPLASLLLCVAGCLPFAYSLFVLPGTTTFSSGLVR